MPGVGVFAFLVLVAVGRHAAAERAVGVVEAEALRSLLGQRAEVPLAGHGGVVAAGLEQAGQGDGVPGQGAIGLGGDDAETAPDAAGHEARAGRAADGGDIVGTQLEAFAGEPVEVRRGSVAAVERHVRPAEVVGHDEDDVRGGRGGGTTGSRGCQEKTEGRRAGEKDRGFIGRRRRRVRSSHGVA
jgi:hypothetical protein